MFVPAQRPWVNRLAALVIAGIGAAAMTIPSGPAQARVFIGVGIGVPFVGYYAPGPYYGYYHPYPYYWHRPWYPAAYPGWRWHHWCRWHPYRCHWR